MPAMAFVGATLVAPAPSAARALRCGWTSGRAAPVAARRRRVVVADAPPAPPASLPMVMSIVITVGDVVVLRPTQSSSAKPSLALVTGVASSGTTADIETLDEFVRSLYVRSGDSTYAAVKEMRPIKADYVDAQDGWIVLPEDVESVASSFQAVPLDKSVESSGEPEVKVVAAAAKEVPEELQGGPSPFPMPTKSQALQGAGVAAVVGLLLYLGYSNVQGTFASSPLVFDEGSQGANVATSYVELVACVWGGAVMRGDGGGGGGGGGRCGVLGVCLGAPFRTLRGCRWRCPQWKGLFSQLFPIESGTQCRCEGRCHFDWHGAIGTAGVASNGRRGRRANTSSGGCISRGADMCFSLTFVLSDLILS